MDKNLKTTLIITGLLFSFIIFLIYLLYCFAYYDKNQENEYFNKIVNYDYKYIFDNLAGKDGLGEEEFNKVLNMMNDKKNLKDIYYLYYRNTETLTLDEFVSKYYYGDVKYNDQHVVYSINGKTGLLKRRAIFYQSIDITNKKGHKSSLGVKRNINFVVEDGAKLKIDNKELKCDKTICKLSKVFGGIHEISYISNGYEYYGLINIVKDKQTIEVTNIDSLVRIDLISDNNILVKDDIKNDFSSNNLTIGKYNLNKCYLNFGCPSTKKSYLLLNDDGSCKFYTYITLDQAGDLYYGTYTKEGNFLVLNFNGHTYQVFDYDTKESTNITADVDIEMRYKIEQGNILTNDSYRFKYSG